MVWAGWAVPQNRGNLEPHQPPKRGDLERLFFSLIAGISHL